MNVTIFGASGASGALGSECRKSALKKGHHTTVLVRNMKSIDEEIRAQITAVEGNILESKDVEKAITEKTDAVVFAIGMKRDSIDYLCTTATKIIIKEMNSKNVRRMVFVSGASTTTPDDKKTIGIKIIIWYASVFMKRKHLDKEKQLEFLMEHKEIAWQGIRPAKIANAKAKGEYRLGKVKMSPLSVISFADCAQEMINMLDGDKWTHDLPFICY